MKTKLYVLGSAILLLGGANTLAQTTFTRITTGAIVTDSDSSQGCAWGDYDGNGFLDLIVGNALGDANALYHNNGKGIFTRITTNDIATTIGDTDGVTWGDYDNDGDLDLFAANWLLPSFLFRNDGGGNFTRIESDSIMNNIAPSLGCSWGDYDSDGFLDLIVANAGGRNEFLYHNSGDGSFTQIESGPVVTSGGDSTAPAWADYDNDGRLDLLLVSGGLNSGQHILFHNDGGGIFTEVSAPPTGPFRGGSPAWGDYDNDGDLDLFIAEHTQFVADLLYRNDGGGVFTPITTGPLVQSGGSSQQCLWGDYDNDGWLDLLVVNCCGQLPFLFHNDGGGAFTRIPPTQGELANFPGNNIGGVAWVDYDNDGFLDLFVARGAALARMSNVLFHNDGNSNKWLTVVCAGRASNRSGIGAKVRVKATIAGASRWQLRDISSGDGFQSCRLRANFGLGDATNVDLVRIEWPSGTVQEFKDVAVNQFLTITEPPLLRTPGLDESGAFLMTLKGARGESYSIEYSTNLTHWLPLTNFIATNVVTTIKDSSGAPSRFYRAWSGRLIIP